MPISFFEWSKKGQNAPTMVPTTAGSMSKIGNSVLERNADVGVMNPEISLDASVPENTRIMDSSLPSAHESRMSEDATMNQRPSKPISTPLPINTRDDPFQGDIQNEPETESRTFQTRNTPAVPTIMFEYTQGKDKRTTRSTLLNEDMSLMRAGASNMQGPVYESDPTRLRRSQAWNEPSKIDSGVLVDQTLVPLDMGKEQQQQTRDRKSSAPSAEMKIDSMSIPQGNIAYGRSMDHDQTLKIRERKTQMDFPFKAPNAYADTTIAAPPLEVAATSVATRDNKPSKDVTASLLDYRSEITSKEPIPIHTDRPASIRMEGNMPRYTQPIQRMNEVATHGQRKPYGPTEIASMHVSDKLSSRGTASNANDTSLTDFQSDQRNITIARMNDHGSSATRFKDGNRKMAQTNAVMPETPLQVPPISSIPIESNLRAANGMRGRDSQRGFIENKRLGSEMASSADMDKIERLVTIESKLASANARMLYDEKTMGREKIVSDSYFKPHAEWQNMHDISGEQRPNATRLDSHMLPKPDQGAHLRLAVTLNQRPFPDFDMQSRLAHGKEILAPMSRKDARNEMETEDIIDQSCVGIDRALKPVDVESTLLRGMPIKDKVESATERTARTIISTSSVKTEPWIRGGEDTRAAYKQPAKYIKNMA